MDWKAFKSFFVGNLNAYATQDSHGSWLVVKERITKDVIESHLKKRTTIGSYNAYYKDHNDRCKWICIDLDLHPFTLENGVFLDNTNKLTTLSYPIRLLDERTKKPKKTLFLTQESLEEYYWNKAGMKVYEIIDYNNKKVHKEKFRIEANELGKLEALSKIVYEFLISFYNIRETDICREKSGRGYHIWIKLKDLTTLKRAWDFRESIREKIKQFYHIEVELFPKQSSLKGLVKGLGNFVKLPYSINRKNNVECVVLDTFDLAKQTEGFEISKIIKEIRTNKRKEKHYDSNGTELDLSKWKPLKNIDRSKFYEKLRPCLKQIVRGRHAIGTYGHNIRRCLANELFKLKAPLDVRINAFSNQPDFKQKVSRFQVLDLEMRCRKNNRFYVSSCVKIAEWGYCLPTCPQLHKAKIDLTDEELNLLFEETTKKGIKGGWSAVRELIRGKINEKDTTKEYIIKTTRSGTTTNIIVESIENNKKILVIAPTIKICEITVRDAIALMTKEPTLFRFGSNTDLCLTLFEKAERIPDLKRFPFLLKDNCQFCSYANMLICDRHQDYKSDCIDCNELNKARVKCNWRVAIEDIQDFDIVYVTTAKIHALTKTSDGDAGQILNNIYDSVDVIFLDEVSEVLDVGNSGITFIAEPDSMYKKISPRKDFAVRFRHEYEMITEYMEANLTRNQKKIWHGIYDYIKEIYRVHKHWKSLIKNNIFLCLDSPLFAILRDIDQWYIEHERRGSGDSDWLKVYRLLIEYTEETDYYPNTIVDTLILAKFPQFYIQYTNPIRYNLKMDILPAKPIKEFLDFLNELSEHKQFFTTDATEPPIPIKKLFPNILELVINDPMDTARKQTVYPDEYSLNISQPRYLEKNLDDIVDYINLYGNGNTMIICQNIYTAYRLRKVLKRGVHFKTLTYFRSSATIGTPSECRGIITIGTPYPPKDSYRWLADLFMKQGLVEKDSFDINGLTKRLEYYNAKSMFFQAISRGKDPWGKVPSSVFCYGLNYYQVKQLLNFPISTPKISLTKPSKVSNITL